MFAHNPKGQLSYINKADSNEAIAPRFFLGRSRGGNTWRFREDLPDLLTSQLTTLVTSEPPVRDYTAPPQHFEAYQTILASQTPISQVWQGPAYFFPDTIEYPPDVTLITPQNTALLAAAFAYVIPNLNERQPVVVMVRDDQAVAICRSVRRGRYAVEAGVETVAAYRGRGFAPRVVAAWALAVRKLGKIPLYSTSWHNTPSQQVARKLGLMMYGVDFHLT